MKGIAFLSGLISGLITSGIVLPAVAQVTSDGTTNTTVNSSGNNFNILNGIQKGNNLFHSFKEFSIPTGGTANFNNSTDAVNIINRVTGGNISNIDGLIKANGNANFFLVNPAGIIFGENASLNIGGSFIGTTAESIVFEDGFKFSATDNTATPLLTISVPVGLQMGSNAGAIEVQGTPANNFFFRTPTLSTAPNQTLALIGGQVDINSANISAPDSRVEIWAMQNGTVNIPTSGNWQLADSSPSPTWGDVTLQQSSNINTSGTIGGAINIRGRGLTVQDGSHIESATGANGQGQGITVQTTEFVDLLGVSHPDNYFLPGIMTSVTGSDATAGNIQVDTQRLRLLTGAWLSSLLSSEITVSPPPVNNSNTGQITIRATDVELQGYNPTPNAFDSYLVSAISTLVTTGSQNNGGAITVDADRVRLIDGARFSTDVIGPFFGSGTPTFGNAGDISVTARESLEIRGTSPEPFTSAIASSISLLALGQAGDIKIDAGQMSLSQGGTITSGISGNPIADIAGQGAAGNITIQATDVQISDPIVDSYSNSPSGITVGIGPNATGQGGNISLISDNLRLFNGGQITSSTDGNGAAGNVNLQVKNIDVQGISQPLSNGRILPSSITASSTTTSDAGSVNIQSDKVKVRDRARLTVSNTGSGNAGNLNINANQIFLDNQASLQAEVNSGNQGNIKLEAPDALILRRGSNITTNATGTSTGGNIDITAGVITAVSKENSDIVANAIEGSGGNISITTQGIFGLEFRDELTTESDITASSQFGVNGTVDINNISIDPSTGLVELDAALADSSQQVATGCSTNADSSFVATGRGGIPQNPNESVNPNRTWSDIRDLSAYRKRNNSSEVTTISNKSAIVEANGFIRNANGEIELVAVENTPLINKQVVSCSGGNT